MSNQTIEMTDTLHAYMLGTSLRESDVQRRLREETATMPNKGMQIAPEQGQFMAMLVKLLGAKRTLEIGTFTGYSALTVALALPEGGQVVACDINDEWTGIARRYWAEAGIADKISLRLGPAVDTLATLIEEGHAGSFDFAFIDADKESYPLYYEHCLRLVRPGGLIALDNAFMGGRVAEEEITETSVQTMHDLNIILKDDARVDVSLVPIGDGLYLVRRLD